MALNRNDGGNQGNNFGNNNNQSFSNSRDEFEREAQMQREAVVNNANTFSSIFNQKSSGPLSPRQGVERLNEAYNKAAKIFSNVTVAEGMRWSVLKFDNAGTSLYAPALIISGQVLNTEIVYSYTIILERDEDIKPDIVTINNVKVTVPQVAGNAWDSKYRQAIRSFVSKQLNVKEDNVETFSACVFGFNVAIVDSRDDEKISTGFYDCVYNASFAINTMNFNSTNTEVFKMLPSKENEVMTLTPQYNRNIVVDAAGREKRADIQLTFEQSIKRGASNSLNEGSGGGTQFGRMTGYLDFILLDDNTVSVNEWGTTVRAVKKHTPLFVVTSMFAEQSGTLASKLMMLMGPAGLANGDEWVQSLVVRHEESKRNDKSMNLSEIGALNIISNLPAYRPEGNQNIDYGPILDTSTSDVSRAKYIDLIKQLCNQGMHIAIDAPHVGAESWYTDQFRLSAMEGEIGKKAEDKIFDTLSDLTDGKFFSVFSRVSEFNSLWNYRPILINTGYYLDNNGERRDIRDIDTLAIANVLGITDPLAITRWATSFNSEVPAEIGLNTRKQMIEAVCGGANRVVFNGISTRLFLNPAVIMALKICASEIGFGINFKTNSSDGYGAFQNRGFAFRGSNGLDSRNISAGNYGGMRMNNNNGFNR